MGTTLKQETMDKLGISELEAKFYDDMNPLNVYCRLLDRGMDKDFARLLCENYETVFYIPTVKYLKYSRGEPK